MKTGICKLCLQSGLELVHSHIIPKWSFKRVVDINSKTIIISENYTGPDSKQYRDFLLCSSCEKKIKVFEDFVCKVAYNQKNESIFIKNNELIKNDLYPSSKVYQLKNNQSENLYKFGLSVIWRASVSANEIYKSIDLGKKYNEKSRLCLMNESDFPDEISILSFLYLAEDINDILFTKTLKYPERSKVSFINKYSFTICGLYFVAFVGKIEENIKKLSINNSNYLLQTNDPRFTEYDQLIMFIKNSKKHAI